jgi:Zn-dependent protease
MRDSFSLGRISGIRVGVNWSVLIIVALLAYGLAVGEFPAAAPRHPAAEYVAAAVVTAVAYMGSLLAHELAHSLVARRNGLQVEGITLWLLGGVSQLRGEVKDPGAEVRVAGVGPLVSLLLGGAFLLVAWLVHAAGVRGVVVVALAWLGAINVLQSAATPARSNQPGAELAPSNGADPRWVRSRCGDGRTRVVQVAGECCRGSGRLLSRPSS